MYWTDITTRKIQRANLDGSGVQDLVTGLSEPLGIKLDVTSGKMYWADAGTQKIQQANLDGSSIQDLVTGLGFPVDIALDLGVGGAPPPPAPTTLVAAVLPSSRSVQVGVTTTAFVTIINAGPNTAFSVGISLASPIPATFTYNETSCATNAVIGGTNAPVDIGAGGQACYVIAITPTAAFAPIEVAFNFAGTNTAPVPVLVAINTLLMSASPVPVADIIALAATTTNDGILHIPGPAERASSLHARDGIPPGAS